MKIISRILILFLAVSAISSNAALYDRGNGMIYDSSLNITWLQDANYAKTSGYDADGQMTWDQARIWTANLNYGGYTDWRLPSARSIVTTYPGLSYDGSTWVGYNNTQSEVGHLFAELGNKSFYDTNGQLQSSNGWANSTFLDGDTNQAINFLGVDPVGFFWEAEFYQPPFQSSSYSSTALYFDARYGCQYCNNIYQATGWAVRDGDVQPVNEVPVPAAACLMGSGLIGLAGIARRKK